MNDSVLCCAIGALHSTITLFLFVIVEFCAVSTISISIPIYMLSKSKFCIFVSRNDCNCSHLFAMVFTNQTFFLYMPKNVNMMYTVKIEI